MNWFMKKARVKLKKIGEYGLGLNIKEEKSKLK
jgi:hypothetical protein